MQIPLFAPRRSDRDMPSNTRPAHARGREIAALLLWIGAVFLALGLASLDAGDWVGPVGAGCARALEGGFGKIAWALPVELVLLGIPFVRGKDSLITPARLAGDLLMAVLAAALFQVGHGPGGLVGELFGELMRSLFSTIGSFLVGFASIGLVLIARASFSFIALMRFVGRTSSRFGDKTKEGVQHALEAWRAARELELQEKEKARLAALPKVAPTKEDEALVAISDPEPDREADKESELAATCEEVLVAPETDPPKTRIKLDPPKMEKAAAATTPSAPADKPQDEDKPKKRERKNKGPTIVDTSAAVAKERADKVTASKAGFKFPQIDFLIPSEEPQISVDREVLFKNAELLVKTLADYGVQGKVEEVLPGPTVTTYEVSTAAGTKVSKVAGLADDLALALAKKVRIVAPIPGKNRIGFELPNERRVPVNLRDLVEDRRFQQFHAPLPVVIGRDIEGRPVYADLASMPHVIVAGATGAGKSVGLNVMLTSLLYRKTPQEMRLLMIDPKVVELAPFDKIPHMLLPVVTDMKQAATALKWAVDEMERRYQAFADAGTKNIATYNAWAARQEAKIVDNVEIPKPEQLASIVIVVDEFADLMMQQGKDVEAAVARLAQKARAAGMHVILATQRPSVDVITGMIKANFPTRIAFRVAQKVDSRTILDEQGAEHLLGRGDMLIKLNGTNETRRVQCPMITEEEVARVTDHLRTQGEPVYDDNILKPRDDEEQEDLNDEELDSMYDAAVRLVADTRRCSTSWLQRKLGLGYNRAARIVEAMEKRGVVGPANGAKDREVLIGSI
jgi:S-DNA-T family DNA segregation ATPase FtsK/SpoIIIE